MGYTITVSAKSKKAKKEMLDFMSEHFKSGEDLFGNDMSYDCTEGGVLADPHLSYDEGASKLGFNYSAGHYTDYAYDICRWMALKIGRKKRFKDYNILDYRVPYMIYDGHDYLPVLVRSEWEDKVRPEGIEFFGEFGQNTNKYYPMTKEQLNCFEKVLYKKAVKKREKRIEVITAELQRLDNLWKEYQQETK